MIETILLMLACWGAATLGVIHRKWMKKQSMSRWDFVQGGVGAIITTLLLRWLGFWPK